MSQPSELHTKYRPSSFKDVLGQDGVVESVQAALEEGRSRAFIFTGPSGTGKTTLSRLIASAMDAELLETDAASHTGVDDMRDIQQTIRFQPLGGKLARVVIIDEAHMLSKSAWNSLLKSVEEPPPGICWCFCTTEPGKIPETIRTRCLVYNLKAVSANDLSVLLEGIAKAEGYKTDEGVLTLCAEKAEGSPRRAITMLAAVADCETRAEAAILLREPLEDGEPIELCRLLAGKPRWDEVMKVVVRMGDSVRAEGVRCVVCAYFSKVALGAKTAEQAERALAVLDAFQDPYPDAGSLHPLLISLGRLLFS